MSGGTARDTKAATAAVRQAETALGFVADASRPRAAARRLNLTDHDFIIGRLAYMTYVLSLALSSEGSMISWRYAEMYSLAQATEISSPVFRAAVQVGRASDAAGEAARVTTEDVRDLGLDTAAARSSYTGLPRAASQADGSISHLARVLKDGAPAHRGTRLDGHAEIVSAFSTMLTSLMKAYANEARLVAGAYERSRLSQSCRQRHADQVSGNLAGAVPVLRAARLHLAIPCAHITDDAALFSAARVRAGS